MSLFLSDVKKMKSDTNLLRLNGYTRRLLRSAQGWNAQLQALSDSPVQVWPDRYAIELTICFGMVMMAEMELVAGGDGPGIDAPRMATITIVVPIV